MSFANLTANLNLNTAGFAKGLRSASKEVKQFAGSVSKLAGGSGLRGLTTEANNSKFAFKDVARVIQGIMLSRVFYAGLQAIQGATAEVWNFAKSLEYADIAYTNLFGDSALAEELLNVLKDYAAVTPFAFQQAEESARRLLAYGVESKNVMFMMQGVLAGSSMTGDPQTVERVSRSLGQIYTKGKLMNEELRQLAEAGIPVYKILNEKLGLTQKQLSNIGRTAIPADVAINALVTGMTEKFGKVIEASATTMQGIISNIKDNLLLIVNEAIQPIYTRIKDVFASFGSMLFKAREAMQKGGLGQVFETMIPKHLQPTVRNLIGSFMALGNQLKILAQAAITMARGALSAIATAANILLPILVPIVTVIANMARVVTQNKQVMQILSYVLGVLTVLWAAFASKIVLAFLLKPLISIIFGVATAMRALALSIVANPWTIAILAIAAALAVVVVWAYKASAAVRNFFSSLLAIGGVNTDKLLLPSQKSRAADLSKFNEALSGTSKGMDDLASSTGKAAKAAKGLLSFDEVFTLKTPDETSGGGGGGGGGGIDLDPADLMPMLPDFGEYAKAYVKKLQDALETRLTQAGFGAIIGGLIGGALGTAIGNPLLGAAIGALVGGIVGFFWEEIKAKLGLSDTAPMTAGIASIIGGVAGGVLTGGSPIGAALGVLAGAIVGLFWDWIKQKFKLDSRDQFNVAAAGAIGGALGGMIGGPIGIVIGALAGIIVSLFWDKIVEFFMKPSTKMAMTGGAIGGVIGAAIGGPIGAILGTIIGGVLGFFAKDIGKWFTDLLGDIGEWLTDIGDSISEWFDGVIAGINEWFANAKQDIIEWYGKMRDGIIGFFTTAATWLYEKGRSILTGLWNGLKNVWETVKGWFNGFKATVQEKFSTVTNWLYEKGRSILTGLWDGLKNVWESVKTWFSGGRKSYFLAWFTNPGSWLWSIGKSIIDGLWNGMKEIWNKVKTWVGGLKTWILNNKGPIEEDRVLLVGAGQAIIGGLHKGMESAWAKVKKSVSGYNSELAGAFTGMTIGVSASGAAYPGHSTGGIFDREHVARIAERNRAEAIVPLDNTSKMQPFVDAVANGITASLAPLLAMASGQQLPPVYVGTLIADDRGLKELNRKMQVIQIQEDRRKGGI